jgi:hypothetical protein
VRLHGLASLPTPDSQVRIARALAGMAEAWQGQEQPGSNILHASLQATA